MHFPHTYLEHISHFSVVLLRLHIPTWHWCLLLAFLLSCDCSSSLCFGTIDSCFSLYTSRNSSASWWRKACLLIFFPCYTPVNDPCIYRRKIQYVIENTDRPPTCCCCFAVSASHLVKNIDSTLCFIVELHSFRGAFCDLFQCQLYYATYSEAVHSCWLFLDRLSR